MKSRPLIKTILVGVWVMLAMAQAYAGSPLWSFTPLSPTTIDISGLGRATVRYEVTNQSRIPHTLVYKAIPGITQDVIPIFGHCPNPFSLAYHESCILVLKVRASLLSGNVMGGPVVCDHGNALQCYQPSQANSLNITKHGAATVGGIVQGLNTAAGRTLTLLNNGTNETLISTNGFFVFSTPIESGSTYDVTVGTQPVGQQCDVINGSGVMGDTNVQNVVVNCSTNFYNVGGDVSGLTGTLTLLNNGTNLTQITTNSSYEFSTPLAYGSLYRVTVGTQPTNQTCQVANASGTVTGTVTDVDVTCYTNSYSVGGIVTGLTAQVTLANNGTNLTPINNDGEYAFTELIAVGSPYAVTVQTQPTNQTTCSVSNGTGIMPAQNVTNADVTCSANTYTLGGTVSGLGSGKTVILLNHGTNATSVTNNSTPLYPSYTFSSSIAYNTPYSVTVGTQPVGQTCAVSNAEGRMPANNVTNVNVTCNANTYSVGGSVTGLDSGKTVILQLNTPSNVVQITNPTPNFPNFTFPDQLPLNTPYTVTITGQPTNQTCTVANASGTVTGTVTNVNVTCASNNTTLSVAANNTIPFNYAGQPSRTGSITVTNTGLLYSATNVRAVIDFWPGVIQDDSNCASIPPQGTCVLRLNSSVPYIARNVVITGDNINSPPTTAIAFTATVSNYLIWSIAGNIIKVIDVINLADNQWGNNVITGADDLYNGKANTFTIQSTPGIGADGGAAGNCYNCNNPGGAPRGTWYLPAICEMGYPTSGGSPAGCASNTANIYTNLIAFGFGDFFAGNSQIYWSSTEYEPIPATNAWIQAYIPSLNYPQNNNYKGFNNTSIRCAQEITLPQ